MKNSSLNCKEHVVTSSEIERGYLYFTKNPDFLGAMSTTNFNCNFLGTPVLNCRLTRGRFIPGRELFKSKKVKVGDVLTMSINALGELVVDKI